LNKINKRKGFIPSWMASLPKAFRCNDAAYLCFDWLGALTRV